MSEYLKLKAALFTLVLLVFALGWVAGQADARTRCAAILQEVQHEKR